MKTFRHTDQPIRIYGLPEFDRTGRLVRLPDHVIEAIPVLSHLGRRCPGARMEFKTDARSVTVRVVMKTLDFDIGMSIYSCQSAFVTVGDHKNATYLGLVNPKDYASKVAEKTFELSGEMQNVTVWLPRNEQLEEITVTVPDEARVEAPVGYKYTKPIVYYGSSITEGGCCCNIFNAYNAIICRHLDTDYVNLGFSGRARGETVMADYISGIDASVFVYDYDHNAPTVEHLQATHEPFFKRIRQAHPDLPVIMMTRPKANYDEDDKKRREVVRATYERAVADGDENVWFIDGESFYGETDRELCSIDVIHPNDLGFFRMASVIEPVIEKILKKQ